MLKRLSLFIMVLIFIGSFSFKSQARDFYYFASLPGLMLSGDGVPFDATTTSTGNVSININNIILEESASSEIINYSLSVTGGVIASDVSIMVEGNNESIAIVGVDPSEIGSSRALSLTSVSSGDTSLILKAVVGGVQEGSANVNITVASNCSASINTTDENDPTGNGHVILCDSGGNYLISSVEDLLHLSHNQTNASTIGSTSKKIGSAILEGRYKLTSNISFPTNFTVTKKYMDKNGDGDEGVKGGDYKFLKDINFVLNSNNVDWDGSGIVGDGADSEGWKPLGLISSNPFKGVFNGSGYEVSGLFTQGSLGEGKGLFGYVVAGGAIKNIGVVNSFIEGVQHAGGLAGYSASPITDSYSGADVKGSGESIGGLVGSLEASIKDSYSTGDVWGNRLTGGLIGGSFLTIEGCYSTGDVRGWDEMTGGLVGLADQPVLAGPDAYIKSSYATGNVFGYAYDAGGLTGDNGVPIDDSYATGDVSALDGWAGGLSSWSYPGVASINNCYATGDVSVSGEGDTAGGLVGYTESIVSNSYSTGKVEGIYNIGGLIGVASYDAPYSFLDGKITNNYALGNVIGNGNIGGLIGFSEVPIDSNYATGDVLVSPGASETNDAGGLVGYVMDELATISNCYATGDVTLESPGSAYQRIGGLVGGLQSSLTHCYATGTVFGKDGVGGLVGGINSGSSASMVNSYAYWSTEPNGVSLVKSLFGDYHAKIVNIVNEGGNCVDVEDLGTYLCDEGDGEDALIGIRAIQNNSIEPWDPSIWNNVGSSGSATPTLKNMP